MQKFISIQSIIAICFSFILSASAFAQTNETSQGINKDKKAAPEADTGKSSKKLVRAKKFMIVTANPHATKAGNDILAQGGNAVDAMIAAQLVLNLVEPQSSGIGGGAFLLYWNQKGKKLTTYDGRETAPASVKSTHFLDRNGQPLSFPVAIKKGLAVGVPGLVRLMEETHKKHGKLPWKKLFQPAIELSEKGFAVSPRLHKLLKRDRPAFFGPKSRSYFFDENGKPRPVGYILKNQEFADTLKRIAEEGAKAFYTGPLASEIVKTVGAVSKGKNGMTEKDLSSYEIKERDPICVEYRKHKVCGMGPPSSGALTIGLVLKLIEPYSLKAGPNDHQVLHYIGEAQKLAYADRARYMADSDFVPVPNGLFKGSYLSKRRELIKKYKAMMVAQPGVLKIKRSMYGKDATIERSGTSHISIIDADGNAVSLTTTIETAFGSRIMVGGFLLNNQLTDFSFKPKDSKGRFIANRIEGGKRPRSSMSPTIVFDKNGEVELVLGSPGGSRIILYVLKTLIAMIDWDLDQQAAVELPNFGSRNGPFEMEGPAKGITKVFLKSFGHKVRVVPMNSGLHVILKADGYLYSGIDPRREGAAMGQ